MKILVTGANGFVGKNLCSQLKNIRDNKYRNTALPKIEEVFEFDVDSDPEDLDKFCREADFVFNLAGVNRPENPDDFMQGNFGFASLLLESLKKHNNRCPVMISSSTQAALNNSYGKSKLAGEELMRKYGEETGAPVLIYRFPNIFGKWCKPNYNSAVATFCHNIANDLPITVNNRDTLLTLLYIDDLVEEMIDALAGNAHHKSDSEGRDFCFVPTEHQATLGQITDLLYGFDKMHDNLTVPDLKENSFEKKLYSTFLSYLPERKTSYRLKMNEDNRGSFTEFIHTTSSGQFSVNVSKPGITKGEHWHHSKNEKFLVVKGQGLIRMRNLLNGEIREFKVSGDSLEVVEMLPGFTHNIINLSNKEDLVTLMWCNENFNPNKPDTYFEPV